MLIRSFTEAFRVAGYDLANPRNQWSAISPDAKSVAITVWSDEIDKTAHPWQVDLRGHPRLQDWIAKPGNSARRKHVKHGLEHCDGRFDIILCKAVDPSVEPRSIEWARPWRERIGVIAPEEFNAETGEYRMQLFEREG